MGNKIEVEHTCTWMIHTVFKWRNNVGIFYLHLPLDVTDDIIEIITDYKYLRTVIIYLILQIMFMLIPYEVADGEGDIWSFGTPYK